MDSPESAGDSEGSWESRESSRGDDDFYLEMDENGIIGLGEDLLWEGKPPDPEEGLWPEANRDLEDDMSELLESDPLSPSPEELRPTLSLCDLEDIRPRNSVAEDWVGEEQENEEEEQSWTIHGQQAVSPPERDGQLEMSEEEPDSQAGHRDAGMWPDLTASGGQGETIAKGGAAPPLEGQEHWEDECGEVKPQQISTPVGASNTVPHPCDVPTEDILLTSADTVTREMLVGNYVTQADAGPHWAFVESQRLRASLYIGSEDNKLGEGLRGELDQKGVDAPSFPVPSPRKGKPRACDTVLASPTEKVDLTARVSSKQSNPGLHLPTAKIRGYRNPAEGPKKVSKGTPCLDGYRRGQLNHRLPDFSQVEAKVQFPKGVYKPPRSKGAARGRGLTPEPPLVFKSPADIVKEVLLSSPDGIPAGPPSVSGSCHPLRAALPQEFRSPQQAHALVHQLQEDYNRLLTKYAEAENTIDRLRLEAKVNLYADPPKASHSVYSGTVSTGSKVMNLTFPQAQRAVMMHTAAPIHPAGFTSAELAGAGHDIPSSETSSPSRTPGPQRGGQLGEVLSKQAGQFQSRLDSFKDLLRSGKLKPSEQIKGLSDLAQGQDALERSYLEARDQHRLQQQQGRKTGPFDPDRELEGQIFRSGMLLEELRERVGHGASERPTSTAVSSPRNAGGPTPLLETPVSPLEGGIVNQEVSSVSGESEGEVGVNPDREGVPSTLLLPLRLKQEHVERDFSTLLNQYKSFKDLPHVLGLGQESRVTDSTGAHTPLPGTDEREGLHSNTVNTGRDLPIPQAPLKGSTVALPDGKPQPAPRKQKNSSLDEPLPRSSSDRRPVPGKSHCSSLTSLAESASSERQAFNLHRPHGRAPPVDGIVSPETDSGFVGSESSRLTPAVRASFQQKVMVSLPDPMAEKGVKSHPSPAETPSVSAPTRTEFQSGTVGFSEHLPSWQREGSRGGVNLSSLTPTSSPQHWAGSITSNGATRDVSEGEDGQAVHSPHVTGEKLFLQQSPSSSHRASGPFKARGCGQLPGRQEAIQSLQAEVNRLRESLESSLRHTTTSRTHAAVLRTRSASPHARSLPISTQREDTVQEEEWGMRRAEPPGPANRRRSTSTPHRRLSMSGPEFSKHIPRCCAAQGAWSQAQPPFVSHTGCNGRLQHSITLSSDEEGTNPGETESRLHSECRHHSLGKGTLRGATVSSGAHPHPQHCLLCKGSGQLCSGKGNVKRDSGSTPNHNKPRNAYRSGSRGRLMETLHPAMLNSVPVVQYVPVYPSVMYYSSPVLKATPSYPSSLYVPLGGSREDTGDRTHGGRRQPRRSHSEDAEMLGRSMSRAIEVASNMNVTSRRMVQSLAVELRHQRALTHSYLH
ncbi:AT-hook-containing transcription factor isoform X2 [Arapaima gigas]